MPVHDVSSELAVSSPVEPTRPAASVLTVRALNAICGLLSGSADVTVILVSVAPVWALPTSNGSSSAANVVKGMAALAATAAAPPAAAVSRARRDRGAFGSDAIRAPLLKWRGLEPPPCAAFCQTTVPEDVADRSCRR